MIEPINLAEKLAQFSEHWAPRTVAQLNDYDIMVVKVQGEFVWHAHANTDDFFLVLKGRLTIRLRDRDVVLHPGELFVVPRGVEHRPSPKRRPICCSSSQVEHPIRVMLRPQRHAKPSRCGGEFDE